MTVWHKGLNLDAVWYILFGMGILHRSDTQRGVVYTVWDGAVTWAEWQNHASALMAEPDWMSCSRFIVDLRSASAISIGMDEVEQAGELFRSNSLLMTRKRGAVIARDEFRNASRFEALIAPSGVSMVVFNSLDTACLFLGLSFIETNGELERLRMQLRGE